MRNKDYYDAYDFDTIEEGHKLKMEHTLYFNRENADLTPFVNSSMEDLQKLREACAASEQVAFENVKIATLLWEQRASLTMLVDRAIEYCKTPEVQHTSNKWQRDNRSDHDIISNKVYRMYFSVYEDYKYDRQTQERIPTAWYVSWSLGLNTTSYQRGLRIAGQDRKRYTDKDAAIKYIEGRKKAYAHLFTEISPPIPQEYAEHFKVNGVLLPGYTIEGQEPITTTRTAAEVLNELSGGAFASKDEKPSVLGKLAASKAETNTAPFAGAKKKEEPTL